MAQLEGNLHALEIELDEKAMARLDEIWPGTGWGGARSLRLVRTRR